MKKLKKILLILYTLSNIAVIHLQAQTYNDSLCRMVDFTDKRFTGYREYFLSFESFGYTRESELNYETLKSNFHYTIDSLKPMNRIYIEKTEKRNLTLNGRYNIFMQQYVGGGYIHIVGLDITYANLYRTNSLIFNVSGCFDNGLPCCTWRTVISWQKNLNKETVPPEEVFIDQTFRNGLLNGIFRVLYNEKEVYRTTFVEGSGYYKAYLPNGEICSQGEIVRGIPHGSWFYFSYDEDGQRDFINIIDYDMGELINNTSFRLNR